MAWENPLVELEDVLDEEERKIEEASQIGKVKKYIYNNIIFIVIA